MSAQDIANIGTEVDKQNWRFDSEPQCSVLMWGQQHKEDVLYVDEQRPKHGTPDYKHFQALQNEAAAAHRAAVAGKGSARGHASAGRDDADADAEDTEQPAEPAFRGADDLLELPEHIDLDRDTPEDAALPDMCRFDPDFQWNPLNWEPFSIAVMTAGGVAAAVKWGHGCSLQLDSTFGCNQQRFPVFTLLAVDGQNHGVPLAYLICSHERADLIQKFLQAAADRVRDCIRRVQVFQSLPLHCYIMISKCRMHEQVRQEMPEWKPSAVLVDACDAEIAAVKAAFGGEVDMFLCHCMCSGHGRSSSTTR